VKHLLRFGPNDLVITFANAFKKVKKYVYATCLLPHTNPGKRARKGQWKVPFVEWRFQSPACAQGAIQVNNFGLSPSAASSHEITSYGWDWGPILMTVGPWKPINLHTYDLHLADVDVRSIVSEALSDVKVTVDLSLSEKSSGSASVTLRNPQGAVVHTEKNLDIESGHARAELEFSSGELELWYPVHYGKQPLYTVEIVVSDAVSVNRSVLWGRWLPLL
jgi:beta-mannosidase